MFKRICLILLLLSLLCGCSGVDSVSPDYYTEAAESWPSRLFSCDSNVYCLDTLDTLYRLDGDGRTELDRLDGIRFYPNMLRGGELYYVSTARRRLCSYNLSSGEISTYFIYSEDEPSNIPFLEAVTESYLVFRESRLAVNDEGEQKLTTCFYRLELDTGDVEPLTVTLRGNCTVLEGDTLLFEQDGRLCSLDLATLETAELGETGDGIFQNHKYGVRVEDWYYYIDSSSVYRAALSGGKPEPCIEFPDSTVPTRLFYDGELLVAVRNTSSDNAHTALYSVDLETLELTELWSEPTGMSVWGIAADADWYYLLVGTQPTSIMAVARHK